MIIRAGAHALAETVAPEGLRFADGVIDLHAARLIHQIERGAIFTHNINNTWMDLSGRFRTSKPSLTTIVRECLRLHLVELIGVETAPGIWREQLDAAIVHLHRPTMPRLPLCSAATFLNETVRWRTLDDPAYADCLACLHLYR